MPLCNCKDSEWLGPCPTHGMESMGVPDTDRLPLHYDQKALLRESTILEGRHRESLLLQGRYKQLSENLQRDVDALKLQLANVQIRSIQRKQKVDDLNGHLKHWMAVAEERRLEVERLSKGER